jgi:prepilin-type N-terminal cleavage/methylation domain-containing protein
MRSNKGFTLVELLVAMVVFVVVLGAAMSFLVTQSRTFRRGNDEMNTLQNMSFGADNIDGQLRTAGSETVDNQPVVVYASNNAFAFNSNYVTNDTTDIFAVYFDPDAPASQVEALKQANQISIPASSPAWNYPSTDYLTTAGTTSTAELITLYFTPDVETSRSDDYTLMRQVNNNAPEVLVRQVLPDSTNLPFFRYYMLRPPAANQLKQLTMVPTAQLPLKHTFATHGDGADTTRIDSLRAVLVSYVITNGQTGTLERTQRISFNVPLPNMGMKQLKICGSEPILSTGLVATWQVAPTNKVKLTWNPAFDENSGEKDVVRYVIWRKKTADPTWTDPLTSIAAGQPSYTYLDNQGLLSTTSYDYRLAAQDCSPKLSTPVIATVVTGVIP